MIGLSIGVRHLSNPRLSALKDMLVETIDRLEPEDGWSLQQRSQALLALRLTDAAFHVQASAPWRRTWQQMLPGNQETNAMHQMHHLAALNGATRRDARRNLFLDQVWSRAAELHVVQADEGGLDVLRYVAGLASPPRQVVFDLFEASFATELMRWPVLKSLKIPFQESDDEIDTSYFKGLLYHFDIETIQYPFMVPQEAHRLNDLRSTSLLHLEVDIQTFFLAHAGSFREALPNLKRLTLSFGSYRLSQVHSGRELETAAGLCRFSIEELVLHFTEDADELDPSDLRAPAERSFRLPRVPPGAIDRVVFKNFPSNLQADLLARSPHDALAHVPHVETLEPQPPCPMP